MKFAILDGSPALHIEKLTNEEPVPQKSRFGARKPLDATGLGKVLLAFSEPGLQAAVMAQPLRAYTPQLQVGPDALRRQLEEIRQRGYASSTEGYVSGSMSIAAPVIIGEVVQAAVALVNYRFDGDLERFIEPLLHAADGIG